MEEPVYAALLITAADAAEAQRITEALINQRKAACVNIIPGVNSLFWWQDKLESAQESLLIVKTKAALIPEIIDMVKEMHNYDVPEIIALPIIKGNPDYLKWIGKEVR